MRFRAHDTFFIRKGWLTKGMKHVRENETVFISHQENPMDVLGIGANMVKALRYWLPAVGLTKEKSTGKRIQTLTPLGEKIYHNDKYLEELGTLFLLHYKLATNKEEATAWYYFFNEFAISEFSREDFIVSLQNYNAMIGAGEDIALRSLNDDFACIINTYLPRYRVSPNRISPENNIDCPLGELGLIDVINKEKKIYRKTAPSVEAFNPWIALAILVDQAKGRKELGLNEILKSPENIGRVFNLDAISMLDILYRVEGIQQIKINRTAGLDVVKIVSELNFDQCIDRYYASVGSSAQECSNE